MHTYIKVLFLCTFIICSTSASADRLQTLYNSLEPDSVMQHLALYELYPQSPQGRQALQHAFSLLMQNEAGSGSQFTQAISLQAAGIDSVVALVNRTQDSKLPTLNESELNLVERLGKRLANRKLKGFQAKTEEEVLALAPEEVDLARGLLLSQNTDLSMNEMRSYEAMIDLMALQLLVRVPMSAAPEQKIRALNHYIFEEMGYRFPPHSLYVKDIDLYTFLPSVLDSRHGVCLGVSILYICLAQRIDLPLEMITPPGHIYVRYREGDREINIETTARGIHIESEVYLGVNTIKLEQRNVKEVIGLAHINRGSGFLQQNNFEKALETYKKAQPYVPNDKMCRELMGFCHLFIGNKDEGVKLLNEVRGYISEYLVKNDSIAEDYLNGVVDIESMRPLFLHVDETRESLIKKKDEMKAALEKNPKFRTGWFHLASLWLQLHRAGEALAALEKYRQLEPNDPTAEYYLSAIYLERYDLNKAWEHLKKAEELVAARQHNPKILKQLRKHLRLRFPE